MAVAIRDLVVDWRPDDAEKLARFMNESGRAWPGGSWDPMTPEDAEARFRDQRYLAAFVVEEGDRIIAYCSLAARPDERHRAYVPLLNAHPDYHGKGYGKAVLLAAVERVYQLGIARVDLHTWAGNLKAVPLYKKSGFMWAPEHPWGVLMQNFTPGARRHPLAQQYFAKHDWYRTMKRDLSLTADEHKRGRALVYPYEWEEDGDRLRMVYDRNSWGLLEIETNQLRLACFLDDEKLVAGIPHPIRWEIVNYQDRPLEIALMASGDEGIELDYKRVLTVADRAELSAKFVVDPRLREKEQEPRAPIVRTDLLINGEPVRLEAGFEIKQAVSFGLDGVGHLLRPGQREGVVLQCWSELRERATAKLRVRGSDAVNVSPATLEVSLPARDAAEAALELAGSGSGPACLRVECEARTGERAVTPKATELWVHFGEPGEVVGHVEKDRVVLESTALHVHISRRGGWMNIGDKVRNLSQAASLPAPQLGVPFAWEEFFDPGCEARLEREGEGLTAVLTTSSVYRPGIWLERRVTLTNLPVVKVQDAIINGTGSRFAGQLKTSVQLRGDWIACMTRKGLVRGFGSSAARNPDEHQLAKEQEAWPETWVSAESQTGLVAGLMWPPALRVQQHGWWNELDLGLPPAAPGESTTPGPVYVYVGDGDHFTVRRWWQNLCGPRVAREQRPPATREALEFGLRPRPVVLHGRRARARLVVDSVGQLELAGRLAVHAPEGLRVSPGKAEFGRVNEQRPFATPVEVKRGRALAEGGYFVDCSLRLDRLASHQRYGVLVLGDPDRTVTVSKQADPADCWQIDNGLLVMQVAARFCGSAISLRRGGVELLRSAFPEARPLAWENPWHGGIEPSLGAVGRELFKEHFTARAITRKGEQGVVWKGVRVSCAPRADRGRHLSLALDYLLAPGSSVLAVAVRTTRRAGASGWVDGGFMVWPVLGGSHLDAVLRASDDDRSERFQCGLHGHVQGQRWVMAENPKAGEAAVLAGHPDHTWINSTTFGRDGYFLAAGRGEHHEAKQTQESVFFLAFTGADRARDLAEVLAELEGLP